MKCEQVLIEASKYDSMFQKIFVGPLEFVKSNDIRRVEGFVKEEIEWAKKNLKREDRIIWYLRIVKVESLRKLLKLYPDDSDIENTFPDQEDNIEIAKEKKSLQKDLNKTVSKGNLENTFLSGPIKMKLLHFIGQERIQPIQDYIFKNENPDVLFKNLEDLEEEWKKKVGTDTVEIQDGDEEVIKFSDGFSWWLLNRGACREEADAMGHCGNVPTLKLGQRILSLRKEVTEDIWKPHLTFILNENGELGEMKGRNNDKPNKKYHPYIIELLKKTDLIEGIIGGGYEPQNNFSLSDLTKEQKENLLKINPNLISIFEKYRLEGPTKEILYELKGKINESLLPEVVSINEKEVILDSWSNLSSFASYTGFYPLENLLDAVENQDMDLDEEELSKISENMIVKDEVYLEILKYIPENYLKKISNSVNIEINSYNDLMDMSENIDKTKYGEIIRKSIIKNYKADKIDDEPDFKNYIELLIDKIYYYSTRNYFSYLDYNIDDIDNEVELKMDLSEFVNVLEASIYGDDGFTEDESYIVAIEVMDSQDWTSMNYSMMEERIEDLKKGKTYEVNEDDIKLFLKFQKMINLDDMKTIKSIEKEEAIDIARYFTRYIDLNENTNLLRLKMLAGVQ